MAHKRLTEPRLAFTLSFYLGDCKLQLAAADGKLCKAETFSQGAGLFLSINTIMKLVNLLKGRNSAYVEFLSI